MNNEESKWLRIKEELEKAGKTKSYYYWMACKELGVDPGYSADDE